MSVRDVLIIGAGPSGLSAAIACKQRGLDYQVLEQGVLVNSIFHFPPQMVFFTTPELLEIGGLPFMSPFDKPTRAEALNYYRKVVDTHDLQICYDEKVLSVEREPEETDATDGTDGTAGRDGNGRLFAVETRSSRGVRRARLARSVIIAIGYYDHPVMINVPGEDLPHVHHYYHEPHPHYRQRVVVVGGGNSAAEAALEMYRTGAHVTLVHRAATLKPSIKYWVRPDIENRIKEGSITAHFSAIVREIRPTSVVLGPCRAFEPAVVADVPVPPDGSAGYVAPRRTGLSHEQEIPADAVYLLTGYRADAELMLRAGVALTERQAPVHDPDTFETNVPGLFVAGGAIAGVDTGTVFI
ncbi:MAG TPA: NAD(P)-binding domain-containing protein, partial [Vicinamibacterales bacterium]|nr:NAD(P)-binding domain-containing protein [Vicinamibacterales bacterium]